MQTSFNQITSNRPFINLYNGTNSSATVRQDWEENSLQTFQDCVFLVDANLNFDSQQFRRGLTFSIRKMNFRYDQATGKCIDYVRFIFPASKTDQICGTFDGEDEIGQSTYLNDPNGIIKVHIFVDKSKKLEASQASVGVELLFTAYQSMLLFGIVFFVIIIIQ